MRALFALRKINNFKPLYEYEIFFTIGIRNANHRAKRKRKGE